MVQVLVGQGVTPKDHHPLANSMSQVQIDTMLEKIKRIKQEPVSKLPFHDDFIANFLR